MQYLFQVILLVFSTGVSLAQTSSYFENAIRVGVSASNEPDSGTIRFNQATHDLEGWVGEWLSLTQPNHSTINQVVDIEGHEYRTVKIGEQVWMRENLRTSRYQNGESIEELTFDMDWHAARAGAWCWYENDPVYEPICGKLYNWYAVNDPRGLCPEGWRVPDSSDWYTLIRYIDTAEVPPFNPQIPSLVAGKLMKTAGTRNWLKPSEGNNQSGFTALPSGQRGVDQGDQIAIFQQKNTNAFYWSKTSSSTSTLKAYGWILEYNDDEIFRLLDQKWAGFSVRCIKNL